MGEPFFIVDDKVYYADEDGTSYELVGADAKTFRMYEQQKEEPYGYAIDAYGLVCGDKRANHIDPQTFKLIPEDVAGRYTVYAKDARSVFRRCRLLQGLDPDTFAILSDSGEFLADKNGVHKIALDASGAYDTYEQLVGADPATFTVLSDGYTYSGSRVFRGTTTVGRVVTQIPDDFTGEMNTLRVGTTLFAVPVLLHADGRADVLDKVLINLRWNSNVKGSSKQLFTHGNRVYFVGETGKVQSLASGDNEIVTIPLPVEAVNRDISPQINDLFVRDNVLYYLQGDNCNVYMVRCALSLYLYDFVSGGVERLATEVSAREIIGYDKESDRVLLRYSEGDAGCFSASYFSYTSGTKELNIVGKSSGCQGDIEYSPPSFVVEQQLIDKVQNDTMVERVQYVNGHIVRS